MTATTVGGVIGARVVNARARLGGETRIDASPSVRRRSSAGAVFPVRPGASPARVRARSMPRIRAGTGEEPGMIESMGRFIGVGLGVVGLSFIAGAQSKKGDDDDDSDEAVSAPKPKSSTSTSTNKPSMPKQTIAGGVAGANNRKKAFPGMPKPAVEGGAQGGSPNNQSSMPSMPQIDVANTVKELMGGAGAGLSGTNNRANNKLSYKWGAAEAMGPREYMEDAWAVKDSGFAGGYAYFYFYFYFYFYRTGNSTDVVFCQQVLFRFDHGRARGRSVQRVAPRKPVQIPQRQVRG